MSIPTSSEIEVTTIQQAWGILPPAPAAQAKPAAATTALDGVLRVMLSPQPEENPANWARWNRFEDYVTGDRSFSLTRNAELQEISDHRRRIVEAFQAGLTESQIYEVVTLPAISATMYEPGRDELFPSPQYVQSVLDAYRTKVGRQ